MSSLLPTAPSSPSSSSFVSKLESYFELSRHNSSIGQEVRAGVASFLTMSYLLLVNPQIMASAGVAPSDAVLATAASSGVSSLIVGIFGNLPFGLAPGLGLSAYLAYGLVIGGITTLAEALTACMAAGILLCLCALFRFTDFIMKIVPQSVKLGIVVGMGMLIAMIGMVSVDLIVSNPDTLVALGDLTDLNLQICLAGVLLVGTLVYHNVTGGILIGISTLTIVYWTLNNSFPKQVAQLPTMHGGWADYVELNSLFSRDRAKDVYPAVGAFLLISVFDISGVIFGLSTLAGLIKQDGTIPRSITAFYGASCGTILASLIGSTPIILTVESASGIKEGGRTGLTAVVIGLLFLASVFLAPLFETVPPGATAPVLILVGAMMMGESRKIEWEDMSAAVPAFLTVVMMPLTYSITNGMVFGLVAAMAFYFTTGNVFGDVKAKWNQWREGYAPL